MEIDSHKARSSLYPPPVVVVIIIIIIIIIIITIINQSVAFLTKFILSMDLHFMFWKE